MAQYWDDWSGSTIGSAPTGWTPRFNTAGVTRTVETETDPVAPAGRRLRVVTSTQARRGFSFDAVDADADRATCEIAVLIKATTPSTDAMGLGAMGRGNGPAGTESAAVGGIARQTTLKERILYYLNGSATQDTGNAVTGLDEGAWVWLRFQLAGTTATLRVSLASDPGTVLLTDTFTISSSLVAGWVGLFDFATGLTWDIAAFGVGTGGDAAPLAAPVVDATAPTLSSPTGSATGATTASGTVSTDEGTGTLYYLVSTSATATSAAVKAGAQKEVTASGSQGVTVTGLTAETSYYLHYLHRDAADNDSAVVTSAQFTTLAAGAAVKGAVVTLFNGTVAQASLSGITARWWDSPTAVGAPLLKTDTASTDVTGLLEIDIDAVTALAVGGVGYLSLYKAGASAESDLHFASRITVSDIG